MDDFSFQASTKGSQKSTHQWTTNEDGTLIQCYLDLKDKGDWNGDNGTFRSGYWVHRERANAEKISNCQIKGTPHIQSKLKTLKSQYREYQRC